MLVRIKGKVEDILQQVGTSKEGKHWAKKTYVIRDTMYSKEEYNTVVNVDEFGKLDPNAMTAEFDNFVFKSNHTVGDDVDLACYLETNKFGFTNVNYGKEYADIDKPKENTGTGNVVKPDAQPAPAEQPTYNGPDASLPTNPEASTTLPF